MRNSIKKKVMTVFIGMMAIVLVISTAILYITINNSERKRVLDEIDQIMAGEQHKFNSIISTVNNCGNYLRYDEELNDVFNSEPSNEYEKNKTIKKITSDISMVYDMNMDSKLTSYSAVFFVNKKLPCSELIIDGSIYNKDVVDKSFRIYTTNGIENEEWFLNTVRRNGLPYTFIDNVSERMYISQMILNEKYISEKDKYLGVSVIGVELYEVLKGLEKIGGYSAAAAITADDKIVLKTKDISDKAFNGDNAYISKRAETDVGVELLAAIKSNQLGMKKRDLINIFSLYIITALIVTLILSSLISKSLTKPITNLAKIMKNIKETEISDLHIEKTTDDEVGELYDSFNYMTCTISDLFNKIEEETKKRYDMEFMLYQNRINPHMLYNTLDSISWLAMLEGNEKIVEMNKLLSAIYRYSIQYSDSMAVLSDELECVKKYVQLQQIRTDYSITLDVEDNDYESIYVPQFILQPLVENSIIHGYDFNMNELMIKISMKKENNVIKIIVEDNGKGCNIDEVNDNLNKTNEHKNIGMRNVNTRIKLKYGERYGLLVQQGESRGIKVIITLPISAYTEKHNKDNENERT